MEYHYRTITCPNCGAVAEKTRTVDSQILKGSPFRVCPNCSKIYFDDSYKEPGLVYFEDKGGEFNFWGIIWAIAAPILTVVFAVNQMWPGAIVFGLLSVLFGYGVFRLIKNRIHSEKYHQGQIDYIEGKRGEISEELKASMERLSNKDYLDALKKHGVVVPDYFYERLENKE